MSVVSKKILQNFFPLLTKSFFRSLVSKNLTLSPNTPMASTVRWMQGRMHGSESEDVSKNIGGLVNIHTFPLHVITS
jgi:hypothetical protein